MQLSDLLTRVASVIQDGANKLSSTDRQAAIVRAIVQRYSKDHPVLVVSDIQCNGTSDLPLPAAWVDGFSVISVLEYPVDQVPEQTVDDFNWEMYRGPAGPVLRLLVDVPESTETARITWTQPHANDASTVFPQDEDAVVDLASAYCFEALAAIYAQTGDASIAADIVNYRTKGQEYLALAKAARKRYFDFFGIEEGKGDDAIAKPALVIGQQTSLMGPGVDRLTHKRPRIS